MKEYAVYAEGIVDNDDMDWSQDWEAAFGIAERAAAELKEGESLFLAAVEDGEFEDRPLEFRMENGAVRQYKGGEALWA